MSVWRAFPLPPNPSWLRTHAEDSCATRNLPLPHQPPRQPWLLRPGLVLLFSSETLSVFCLLHGCCVSLRFFPRLSFPSDLGEVRDAVAIQDSFCRRVGKGASPGQKVSDDGTRSSVPLRPSPAPCSEGHSLREGWGLEQGWWEAVTSQPHA